MLVEIDAHNIQDINKPNQPFLATGRLCPALRDGQWHFTEVLYDIPHKKYYPDEEQDYAAYIGHPDKTVFFYYADSICAAQIRLRKNWNRYAFIEDIAVARDYRGQGIGRLLIEKAAAWAKEKGLCGLALETQDANLPACRFYAKMGFVIGAVDTMLYSNFDDNTENAIFWYMKF